MKTPYEILGEDGVQNLCNAFYEIMDEEETVKVLRAMHAADLEPMKTKLFEYLSGWMGGPQLYSQHYGTVCMTTPHKPYRIGPKERDQWLLCMDKALERIGASSKLKTMLKDPMFRVADAVKNHHCSEHTPKNDNLIATG
tara:strand:- start:1344 stop:1763 length:420 start_codon:yes stop_codon:yes gene_type:complete